MVLFASGQLYTFGFGQQGQLGHRNAKTEMAPKFVEDFTHKKVKMIAAGHSHSLCMTEEGDVFACGSNKDGQLGVGDIDTRKGFTHVSSLTDKNIYRIFAGGNHSWVLLDEIIPMRRYPRAPSPLEGDKATD